MAWAKGVNPLSGNWLADGLLYADIELFCMTRGVLFLDGHIGISIPHAWRLPYPESRDSSLKKFGSKYSQGDFYD